MDWLTKRSTFLFMVATLILGGILTIPHLVSAPQGTIVCTQEAKQCPDGNYVGRTGPNCDFAACPNATSTLQGTGILQGTMTIGPICPVEQVDHPCKPTPEMYAAHRVFVYNSNQTKLITTLMPDADGNFSTTLPVATYYVDVKHQSIGAVRGVPKTLSILRNQSSILTISIDTGIR